MLTFFVSSYSMKGITSIYRTTFKLFSILLFCPFIFFF
uniref:Uncharacterized protein n=1 Tax=Siphoviridae sp. ctDOT22 TaxID=2827812 RepID=A0A8S5SW26_9CAUD|nr:MAG TPA: hypothetical protein [Siphoviridae sp. ctDOT22]